jgi:hypothetical protein
VLCASHIVKFCFAGRNKQYGRKNLKKKFFPTFASKIVAYGLALIKGPLLFSKSAHMGLEMSNRAAHQHTITSPQ